MNLKPLIDFLVSLFTKRPAAPVVVLEEPFPIPHEEMESAITASVLGAAISNRTAIAASIRSACAGVSLSDKRVIAHMLAHAAHESGDFTRTEENLRYSERRLLEVFSSRVTPEMAKRIAGDSYAIAEQVYGNRPRLGNTMPGDGYAHRGIFWPQLTGGDAHRQFAAFIGRAVTDLWSLKDDIATNAQALVWFAAKYKTAFVETASTGTIEQSTRLWNGGLNGLADRAKRYARICAALGIDP